MAILNKWHISPKNLFSLNVIKPLHEITTKMYKQVKGKMIFYYQECLLVWYHILIVHLRSISFWPKL